jgi:hypothetical protein
MVSIKIDLETHLSFIFEMFGRVMTDAELAELRKLIIANDTLTIEIR